MKRFIDELLYFFKKAWYWAPLVFVSTVAYGYGLLHTAVGVDDLVVSDYLESGTVLSKGRIGAYLVAEIFGLTEFKPFLMQFLALLLFILAATCLCALMRRVSEDRLHPASYPLFACLMVTYPLIAEAWTMDAHAVVVCAGYLMTAATLLFMERFIRERKWYFIISAFIMAFLFLTTYEPFAGVYICGVLAILILRWIYGLPAERRLKRVVLVGLVYAIPLALCTFLRLVFMPHYAITRGSFVELLKVWIVRYVLYGKWYLPIGVLDAAAIAAVVMALVLGWKKNKSIWLLFFGLCFTPFALDLFTGGVSNFITQQTAALLVAFIGMLVFQLVAQQAKHTWVKNAVAACLFLLCFGQAVNVDNWIRLDQRRYTEELSTVTSISNRLEETCDLTKPVVFIGLYLLDDEIMNACTVERSADPVCNFALKLLDSDDTKLTYVTTACYPLLQWGIEAFEPGQQIQRFCRYHGLRNFSVGTAEQYAQANMIGTEMSVWPAKDSVMETETFIIVKLGDIWIPPTAE